MGMTEMTSSGSHTHRVMGNGTITLPHNFEHLSHAGITDCWTLKHVYVD
jgi:hypothetical protein